MPTAGPASRSLPQYCNVPAERLEDSFFIMEKLLAEMDALSGHRLVVVSVPDKEQLRDDLPEGCEPELVEARLYAITGKLDIPFSAVYPRLQELNEELYFAGHLNERGHQVVADVMYEALNQD